MKNVLLPAVLLLLAAASYAAAPPPQSMPSCAAGSTLAEALGLAPAAASPQVTSAGAPIGEMPVGCQLTNCTQARQQCLQVDCPGCKVYFSCIPSDPCSYSCTCHNCAP